MVGFNFPSKLTEEEEAFQKKLAKLKKKKKAIAAAKVPKLEKQESVTEAPQLSTEVCPADEQAKKLKKLAAIKEALASKDKTFKRTKRRGDSEAKASVTFHPFTQSENEPQDQQRGFSETHQKFDNEVSSSSRNNDSGERCADRPGASKMGRTLYVQGHGLTESLIQNVFQSYGDISNISMENEKNCAFVTYVNYKSADDAIQKVNGTEVENVMLRISFARKQPSMDSSSCNDANAESNWFSNASSSSQKVTHKDKRNLVIYDDDIEF